jgi:hypothetical protein
MRSVPVAPPVFEALFIVTVATGLGAARLLRLTALEESMPKPRL